MTRHVPLAVALLAILFGAPACSQHTSITGEGKKMSQVIHGSIGMTGEDHRLTILAGSDVTKLSIMGEDIRVTIEEGARVRKIEIIGEDNEIIAPADLEFEYSDIGEENEIKHR